MVSAKCCNRKVHTLPGSNISEWGTQLQYMQVNKYTDLSSKLATILIWHICSGHAMNLKTC